MNNPKDFQIDYWKMDDYSYKTPKKRSNKRKLLMVFLFVAVLAITPALIFSLVNLKTNTNPKISSVSIPAEPQPKAGQLDKNVPTPTPVIQDLVEKGDSYWRLSKRNCGSGKYYTSIQNQNGGKPLHQGESVKISCTL
ncbi:MAG: hypothetical protein AAB520_01250 [Patescibacteria group bacterium]